MDRYLNTSLVRDLAKECGFQLAEVTLPQSTPDYARYQSWVDRGLAGEMRYLTDHRAKIRQDVASLLPGCRSIICVGMIYNGPEPYSIAANLDSERLAWISRYAWGQDYHWVLKSKLEQLAERMRASAEFEWRACVDTAPLLERSLAKQAGLGWIGKNTCLINQELGSWIFLGELLTTLALEPSLQEAPDRCGTCTRCIESCPTNAIVPSLDGRYEIDARRCISYFTIELRGPIPESERNAMGNNVFGCDICQDVCPWNAPRRAGLTSERAFQPQLFAPPLMHMANLSREDFRSIFRDTPVSRAKYSGFLRNVAIAMGNGKRAEFVEPLLRLTALEDSVVVEAAQWALEQIHQSTIRSA